jgi:hypothetical protein
MEELEAVLDLDKKLVELCQVHKQEFPPAKWQKVPLPEPVDPAPIANRLIAKAVTDISPLNLWRRREARKTALGGLDDAVAGEKEIRAMRAAELQRKWDLFWERTIANDPDVVLAALEQAFEDNQAPAVAVSCRDARVDLVMRWPTLDDVVSERKAAVTPGGKPTIHKRKQGERAELYLEAMSSNALATIKETLAVCPNIESVGLAVVRPEQDPVRGDQTIAALVLALVSRQELRKVQWDNIHASAALLGLATGRVGMRGKGANKTLFGLDLSDDSEERDFIGQVAKGLGARVPDDGVDGISLPVKVVLG